MKTHLAIGMVQRALRPFDELDGFAAEVDALTSEYPEVELFVFPELYLCGPSLTAPPGSEQADSAELLDGPRDRVLSGLARKYGIWLVPGSVYELGEDGEVYNTALVYAPDGRRVASYRKIFPWRPAETTRAGDQFVVFDLDGRGLIGLSVCYDNWFPEHARQLAWMGADLILNVVHTTTSDRAQEVVLTRANAIANQVFVASVNSAAPEGRGHSLLADPEGRIRVEDNANGAVVLTDVVDLGEARRVRRQGTAGVTRVWSQYEDARTDPAVALPIYGGSITPNTWGNAIR